MAHHTTWLYPGHVVHATFSGIVSIEDIKAANAEARELIMTSRALVHILVDTTPVEKLDFGLPALMAAAENTRPNIGWRIIITDNRMIRMFASVALQTVSGRYRCFVTFQE